MFVTVFLMWTPRKPTRALCLLHPRRIAVLFKNGHRLYMDKNLSAVLACLAQEGMQKLELSIGLPEYQLSRHWQMFDKTVEETARMQFLVQHGTACFGKAAKTFSIDCDVVTVDGRDCVGFVAVPQRLIAILRRCCYRRRYRVARIVPITTLLATGLWLGERLSDAAIMIVDHRGATLCVCRRGNVSWSLRRSFFSAASVACDCLLRQLWQHALSQGVLGVVTEILLVDVLGIDVDAVQLPMPIVPMSQERYWRLTKIGISLCQ